MINESLIKILSTTINNTTELKNTVEGYWDYVYLDDSDLIRYHCSGTITENSINMNFKEMEDVIIVNLYGRFRIGSMTRSGTNPGIEFEVPFHTYGGGGVIGGVVISGGAIKPESVMVEFYANVESSGEVHYYCRINATETITNMANGNFILGFSTFLVLGRGEFTNIAQL